MSKEVISAATSKPALAALAAPVPIVSAIAFVVVGAGVFFWRRHQHSPKVIVREFEKTMYQRPVEG